MRRAAALILAVCAVVLLLTWHSYYHDGPVLIWELPGKIHLTELEIALKVAGGALLAAALLVWPRRPTA